MAVSIIKHLEQMKKGMIFLSHLFTGLQIIVILTVFICSLYLALQIVHNHMLDFLTPFIEWVKDFTSFMFGNSIKSTLTEIDGRLVLFMLCGVFAAFFLSQLKYACKRYASDLDKKIVEQKRKEEAAFNVQLEQDLKNSIISQRNYLIIVQFKAKSTVPPNSGLPTASKEELDEVKKDVLTKFYGQISTNAGLTFKKDQETLLIMGNNVDKIDYIFDRIFEIITMLKPEYKSKQIAIRAKLAVDVFTSSTPITKVYNNLKSLYNLNSTGSEVICYGNFKNRYSYVPNAKYQMAIKGKYDIDESHEKEETIWTLVKKS